MSDTLFPVSIGARRYITSLRGFYRRPLTSTRQLQDSSREPSDATFDVQGVWKRTAWDFQRGAGQEWLDLEEDSHRARFRTSKGIDPWTRRSLSLLPDTASATTVGDGTTGCALVAGDYLYVGSGSGVTMFNGSTWTACTGLAGTAIKAMAVVGGYIYVAGGSTLKRVAVGSTAFASFGALTPDVIGTGGGRLVGADGAELYEIDSAGAKVAVYTHFDSGFVWRKIIAAPNGIYCFGDDANGSQAWLLTVADATGELAPPYPAGPYLGTGEFIRDVTFYGGVLVLATSKGVHLCTINGNGFLTAAKLIEIGDVECLTVDGDFVWFGWTNFDGSSTGLGRLFPSKFTDTMVPAYASDLMATDQGEVRAVASFEGKRYFLVNDSGTGRVYAQSASKVASGSLWSGGIFYGTPESKVAHSVEGYWATLPAGASVTISALDGIGGSALSGGLSASTATNEARAAITGDGLEEFEVKITLNRATDTTTGPELHRWTLRASLVPFRSEEIILPIYLADGVAHNTGGEVTELLGLDPHEQWDYLHDLMISQEIVTTTFGKQSEQVKVDAIGVSPDVQDVALWGWTPDEQWVNGVWAVRLQTVEPTT